MTDSRPLVLFAPAPQRRERIFTAAAWQRLQEQFTVVDVEADPEAFTPALPEAFAIVGQPDLPTATLRKARQLKAIVNVEGNFFPNVDYATAFAQGVRVLGCGPAYAQPVAEFALAMALDLARGVTQEDRAAREGRERYVSAGNADAILLRHAKVGILGYGNIGARSPPAVAAVPAHHSGLRSMAARCRPARRRATGGRPGRHPAARPVSVRPRHRHRRQRAPARSLGLALLPDRARVVLVSRAHVADYDAVLEFVRNGRVLAGIDVWPEEPIPADSPFRREEGVIISGHRAGGIPEAFLSIGDMACDDLELLARGLPPVRLQPAAPELVGRYRNRPVD